MIKKLKVTIFAKFIFILVALCFLFGIYLSIPVLFNYKSIEKIIQDKFYYDFNVNLNINGDIKYQLLPKPHLLISESSLSINDNNDVMSVDVNNLKIYLNSSSLYPKSKLNFEKFEINKKNFLLKKKEYNILRNYFHKSETKPFKISKSKIFILDEKGETLVISPIEKIIFNTSKKDNVKKLIIKGNIFDLNFKSLWKKKFNSEMNSQIEIDFKEPNISIKNKLEYGNISNLKGLIFLSYLNQNIEINYKLNNNLIIIKSPDNNNDIKIDSIIELRPFYLKSNINLNKQNLNFLTDELIYSLLSFDAELLGNLNGEIKLYLTNIENEIIRNGQISFDISQKTIKLRKALFNLGEIGTIESEIKYVENNGDLIFNSINSLLIKNKKRFARKFQIKPSKILDLDRVYFKIEKNISTGSTTIFDIKTNLSKNEDKIKLKYKIKNSQELKSLVKNILDN